MFTAHANSGDRFYMRKLLLYMTGVTSFEDLRTHDNVLHATYKEACMARGLLIDDQEWKECLLEAGPTVMPKQLRYLFVTILVHNNPSCPADLWNLKIEDSPLHDWMAHDFYRDRTGYTNCANVGADDVARVFHTLDDIIRDVVTKNEKTIHNFHLCDPAPVCQTTKYG